MKRIGRIERIWKIAFVYWLSKQIQFPARSGFFRFIRFIRFQNHVG